MTRDDEIGERQDALARSAQLVAIRQAPDDGSGSKSLLRDPNRDLFR